jgi:hypothetical protein
MRVVKIASFFICQIASYLRPVDLDEGASFYNAVWARGMGQLRLLGNTIKCDIDCMHKAARDHLNLALFPVRHERGRPHGLERIAELASGRADVVRLV